MFSGVSDRGLCLSQSLRDPGCRGTILTQATGSTVLDMLSLLLTFHWPKQDTWPPNFKEPESYPSTTCLSRRENRNTWTAALMPIVIRMTNCPHLSGPRAFLECTLRAITEKVQGKPGWVVHPPCTMLYILHKLISQWLHSSPSSRWVMVFLPNPLLLET